MSEFDCDIPEVYDASRSDCPLRDGSICVLDGMPCEFLDDDFDEME